MAEQSIKLPRCFGQWEECRLCVCCVLEFACQLHRVTPRELWAEIEGKFVDELSERERERIRSWIDVLDGLV